MKSDLTIKSAEVMHLATLSAVNTDNGDAWVIVPVPMFQYFSDTPEGFLKSHYDLPVPFDPFEYKPELADRKYRVMRNFPVK